MTDFEKFSAVITVEGSFDVAFIKYIVNEMSLSDKVHVHSRDTKDKKQLERFFTERLSSFTNCSSILIINDDDGNFTNAEKSIQSVIENVKSLKNVEKLLKNMKIEKFIIQNDIEHLLMKIAKFNINDCIDHFISCLQSKNIPNVPKKIGKTKFFAYLAAMKEPTDKWNEKFVYDQFFDLKHECLLDIKTKIESITNII